jgi:RNA polymerase sigma-70 factor (ECF subfamily)
MSPDRAMQARELWQVVRACLSSLPQGQADVFTLSVMEELESEEICRQLDISPSNLWVRLHRARLGLAKCVSAKWFREETPHHVK